MSGGTVTAGPVTVAGRSVTVSGGPWTIPAYGTSGPLFGVSTLGNGQTNASILAADQKYGKKIKATRVFCTAGFVALPSEALARSGIVSAKTLGTAAATGAYLGTLPNNGLSNRWLWAVHHEPDPSDLTPADFLALQAQARVPGVALDRHVVILTGWGCDPRNSLSNIDQWVFDGLPYFGCDFDGNPFNPSTGQYTEYRYVFDNLKAAQAKHGFKLVAPEWQSPRADTQDTDGALRVAWFEKYKQSLIDYGFEMALIYEGTVIPNSIMRSPAEIAEASSILS